MSARGTKLTSRNVCDSSAYEAEADMPKISADFRWRPKADIVMPAA
jgi:hypothetical protein